MSCPSQWQKQTKTKKMMWAKEIWLSSKRIAYILPSFINIITPTWALCFLWLLGDPRQPVVPHIPSLALVHTLTLVEAFASKYP